MDIQCSRKQENRDRYNRRKGRRHNGRCATGEVVSVVGEIEAHAEGRARQAALKARRQEVFEMKRVVFCALRDRFKTDDVNGNPGPWKLWEEWGREGNEYVLRGSVHQALDTHLQRMKDRRKRLPEEEKLQEMLEPFWADRYTREEAKTIWSEIEDEIVKKFVKEVKAAFLKELFPSKS